MYRNRMMNKKKTSLMPVFFKKGDFDLL